MSNHQLPASRLLRARKMRRAVRRGLLVVLCLCLGVGAARFFLYSPNPSVIFLRPSHPDFLGRKSYLKTLEKDLLSKKWSLQGSFPLSVKALWGIGGIGKTELAIKYANDHTKSYSLIWRFNCESKEAFEKSYRILAHQLHISMDSKVPIDVIKQKVHSYLERMRKRRPWLLIFDNVEEEITDKDLPARGGAVLITARERGVRRNANECLQVVGFSKKTAARLLMRVTGESRSKEIESLIETFQYFPLALNHVAHYISETPGIDSSKYLRAYLEKQSILKAPQSEDHRYRFTLGNVWDLTLKKLKNENPLSVEFLELCSFFSPDHIPLNWFEKDAVFQGRVDEILRCLERLALIIYNKEDRTISLHRLMRKAIQESQERPEERLLFATKLLISNESCNLSDVTSWKTGRSWYIHANALIESSPFAAFDSPSLCCSLYSKIAKGLFVSRDFQSALYYSDLAINLARQAEIEEPSLCQLLYHKARNLSSVTRFAEARDCLCSAIEHCRVVHKGICKWEGMSLDALIRTYNYLGMFPNALQTYKEGFEFLESMKNNNLEVGIVDEVIPYNLSWVLMRMDQIEEAEKIGLRALSTSLSKNSKSVILAGWIHMILSRILNYEGKIEKAEKVLEDGTTIFRKSYPKGVPFFIMPFVIQAEILQAQGKFEEALKVTNDCLDACMDDQLKYWVAILLSCKGVALAELGNLSEAISHHKQVVDLLTNIFGNQHIDVAREWRRLGKCFRLQGHFEKAIVIQERVIAVLSKIFPAGHSILAAAYKEMGSCLYELGRHEEGLIICKKALEYWDLEAKRENPQKAKTLRVMGKIYRAMGERDKAQEAILEAFLVAHRTYYAKHPDLKQYCIELFDIYSETEDATWKQKAKESAHSKIKKTMGRWHQISWNM